MRTPRLDRPLVNTFTRPYERLNYRAHGRPLIARDDRPPPDYPRPTQVRCRHCSTPTGNVTDGVCLACEPRGSVAETMWLADEIREWVAEGRLNGYLTDELVLVLPTGPQP